MPEVTNAFTNFTKILQAIGGAGFILSACYLAIQAIFRGVAGIITLMLGLAGAVISLMVLFLAGPIGHAVQTAIGSPSAGMVVLLPW